MKLNRYSRYGALRLIAMFAALALVAAACGDDEPAATTAAPADHCSPSNNGRNRSNKPARPGSERQVDGFDDRTQRLVVGSAVLHARSDEGVGPRDR